MTRLMVEGPWRAFLAVPHPASRLLSKERTREIQEQLREMLLAAADRGERRAT